MQTTMIRDPLLPTLDEVVEPTTIGAHLGRIVAGHGGDIQEVEFQILKHHPGSRCTFEMAFRTAAGPGSVIGKVYASDRADVYRAMQAIQRSGFGPDDESSIPQPLAYLPELRLLLQEKVDGTRAKLVFLTGAPADRADAAARAARWLARFHAVAPQSGRIAALTEQLDAVERWSLRIAARMGEPFASPARRLAQRIGEEAAAIRTARVCAGHGSYNCHQIILGEGRTVTCDWDGYDLADPCRDVARFVVALQRLAVKYLGSVQALDDAAEVFLTTYRARSPHDVTSNLAWYRAVTCLRLAKYEANRPVCTFPEGIEALLDEGLRVLEEKNASSNPGRQRTGGPTSGECQRDQDIPRLQTVLGQTTMAEHLRRVLPDRCGSVTEIGIQIRKRHRTRCTFDIEWPGGNGDRAVIGKVYAVDREDVYRAMDAVRRAGFGPDDEFSIPEPLAYVPELRLLLQERVSGPHVKDVLLAGAEPDRVEASERCARWLARFQAVVPGLGQPCRVADVVDSVSEWSQSFGAPGGMLADRARRLRKQLEAEAGGLEPTQPCAGHGHYTCGQILFADSNPIDSAAGEPIGFAAPAKQRTVTFDWDGYDSADPCRDVACFVVDLERRAWKDPASRTALDQAAAIFLKTYLSLSRGSAAGNLPFYAAALCLRLARRDVEKHATEKAAAMLDAGLRILEQRL